MERVPDRLSVYRERPNVLSLGHRWQQ